jgi:p-cumate 2,3-dioxygenase alpha subunit
MSERTGFVTDDRGTGIFQVRREAYTSEAVLAEEEERIFSQCWLYVGHESEIPRPNDFVSRTVARRPLILTRNGAGEVRVLINSCMHRGAEVCRDERGNSRIFRCFYHAWTYDTDGRLINVPDRPGYPSALELGRLGLTQPARVATYRGFVFASFGADVADLPTYLGEARDYLDLVADQSETGMEVVGGTHKYSISANWKLLVENSLDGYHLLPLHKSYFDFAADSGDTVDEHRDTRAVDLGNGHALIVDRAPWGRPTARWAPSLGVDVKEIVEERRRRLVNRLGAERGEMVADTDRNLLVFPNLVICATSSPS